MTITFTKQPLRKPYYYKHKTLHETGAFIGNALIIDLKQVKKYIALNISTATGISFWRAYGNQLCLHK